MVIVNRTEHSLPTKRKLTYVELREKAQFQVRRHIHIGATAAPGSPGPLNPDEWMKLREYDAMDHLATAPKWNGQHFNFEPWGKQGCAIDIPNDIATFLMTNYNLGAPAVCKSEGDLIIDLLHEGEELPKGVTPVRLDVDDPLNWSSEGYYRGGVDSPVSYSKGRMEAPKPYGPKDVAIPARAILEQSANLAK